MSRCWSTPTGARQGQRSGASPPTPACSSPCSLPTSGSTARWPPPARWCRRGASSPAGPRWRGRARRRPGRCARTGRTGQAPRAGSFSQQRGSPTWRKLSLLAAASTDTSSCWRGMPRSWGGTCPSSETRSSRTPSAGCSAPPTARCRALPSTALRPRSRGGTAWATSAGPHGSMSAARPLSPVIGVPVRSARHWVRPWTTSRLSSLKRRHAWHAPSVPTCLPSGGGLACLHRGGLNAGSAWLCRSVALTWSK
mmetsp:Transcript_13599/g.38694  ORF Transcript_13599/g.38694 Transcript_13599/m.38694 type:complete len:253 (+) Transcript_13599:1377-2135(+)